jgi:hypothetical protein
MAVNSEGAVCPGCGVARRDLPRPHRCPGYPYLGPVPAPSHPLGVALISGSVVFAILALVRAALYWQRAGLDRQLVEGVDVHDAIVTNAGWMSRLSWITTAGIIGFVVIDVLWRRRRRPISTLQQWGEACVESPLRVVYSPALGLTTLATLALWGVAFVNSLAPGASTAAELVAARKWSAVGYLALAVLWVLVTPRVLASQGHLARRVARSGGARLDPAGVGFIAPTPPSVARGAGRGGRPRSPQSWRGRGAMLALCALEAVIGVALVANGQVLGVGLIFLGALMAVSAANRGRQEVAEASAVGPGSWSPMSPPEGTPPDWQSGQPSLRPPPWTGGEPSPPASGETDHR